MHVLIRFNYWGDIGIRILSEWDIDCGLGPLQEDLPWFWQGSRMWNEAGGATSTLQRDWGLFWIPMVPEMSPSTITPQVRNLTGGYVASSLSRARGKGWWATAQWSQALCIKNPVWRCFCGSERRIGEGSFSGCFAVQPLDVLNTKGALCREELLWSVHFLHPEVTVFAQLTHKGEFRGSLFGSIWGTRLRQFQQPNVEHVVAAHSPETAILLKPRFADLRNSERALTCIGQARPV